MNCSKALPLPASLHYPGMNPHHEASCTLANELKGQLLTGMTVLDATGASAAEVVEMHKQFLVYLIMHEMGHTLGLNHNMKASQMLTPAEDQQYRDHA